MSFSMSNTYMTNPEQNDFMSKYANVNMYSNAYGFSASNDNSYSPSYSSSSPSYSFSSSSTLSAYSASSDNSYSPYSY